ncbi:hypothetical protein TNCV_1036821 [Trichonephila clavipes]|nr:hypothetical protein TNCV_1036821 [Trichonephila clavipes]
MSEEKVLLKHCMSMLFEFPKENNTIEIKRNSCDVFAEETVTARICQRWLLKFCLDDFSLKDEHRSEKPSGVRDEAPLLGQVPL